MDFFINYRQEFKRIIQAITIDNRVMLGIQDKNGNIVQEKIDVEVAAVGTPPLFYVIESEIGNLCGYFYLKIVNNSATLGRKNFRPQYSKSFSEFDTMIQEFIASDEWRNDYLA